MYVGTGQKVGGGGVELIIHKWAWCTGCHMPGFTFFGVKKVLHNLTLPIPLPRPAVELQAVKASG